MCGIAGILNLNGEPVSTATLQRMTDTLVHRGPDGEGYYTDSGIGLGHKRLAIIDLSEAGRQPMVSNDSQVAITYNGEIYNFKELRKELESKGHIFKSKTDSEVVLNAWVEWGADCVIKFNGMFAFAVWDKRVRQETGRRSEVHGEPCETDRIADPREPRIPPVGGAILGTVGAYGGCLSRRTSGADPKEGLEVGHDGPLDGSVDRQPPALSPLTPTPTIGLFSLTAYAPGARRSPRPSGG